MSSTTALPQRSAERAAHLIADDGIDAHPALAERLVRIARRLHLSPTLCDLLADHTAPAVARERAYGMLTAQLAAAASQPPHTGGMVA